MSESNANTKKKILQSKYAINGKELNTQYSKISRWEMKNALRELNQKRIKSNPAIKNLKDECRVGNKLWNCPHCKKEVGRLTSAHVGEPVCKIIDKILDEHYPQKNIHDLYSILRTKHDDISIVICCDECNKLLEEECNIITDNHKCDIQSKNKILKDQVKKSNKGQSQKHGFTFENSIRKNVFDLPKEPNNTDKYDIPKDKNKYNQNENCSIKTTGSTTICCGDIIRFYEYDFTNVNTIFVVKYKQTETQKIVKCIYEIDYNLECHKLLFGNLPKEIIENYVKGVKSIPTNIKGPEAKKIFNYLTEKKILKQKYNNLIQINPKVDSSQSRVQCSIPNFETTLKDFIKYKSPLETPNLIRGKAILESIESCKRPRNTKIKQ